MSPFLFRRIRGPVFLLCFAVTAILSQWGILSFARSWPLYIVAAGLLRLGEVLFYPAAQAHAYPAAAPSTRRPSLALAVAELLFGIFALLLAIDALSFDNFWHVYALWWPLLLVIVGVALLVERLFDRSYAQRYGPGVYLVRSRSGGGLALLIFVFVALGLASHGAEYWAHPGGWNENWNFDGESHENDVHLLQPFAGSGTLLIENGHGDVEIAPSTDGMIHVDAHQTAHVRGRTAERAFRDARPVLDIRGEAATLTAPGRNNVDVRLVLAVPPDVLCTVHNAHGDIAVSGLRRALEIREDHGDVTLDDLGASAHLAMDHGDVHARSIGGDLLVDGEANDIAAADVHGRTLLHGEFFGDTQLDNLHGPVEFHSNRTTLDAEHVGGDFTIDGEDLRIGGVTGGLRLATRSKNVEITGLSGGAQITDSNGDISLGLREPFGAITLADNTGNVTLSAPPGSSFSLRGQTGNDDQISSEWPLAQGANGEGKTIAGQIGQGGPSIEIRTEHGDLTLRRATAETPEKPDRAERVEKPEHVRHLESPAESSAPTVQ